MKIKKLNIFYIGKNERLFFKKLIDQSDYASVTGMQGEKGPVFKLDQKNFTDPPIEFHLIDGSRYENKGNEGDIVILIPKEPSETYDFISQRKKDKSKAAYLILASNGDKKSQAQLATHNIGLCNFNLDPPDLLNEIYLASKERWKKTENKEQKRVSSCLLLFEPRNIKTNEMKCDDSPQLIHLPGTVLQR